MNHNVTTQPVQASSTTRRLALIHFAGCLWLLGTILPAASAGEIYKWVDENGKTHFSERRDPAGRAQSLQLKSPMQPPSAEADVPSATYWQKQETQFRQRQAQKSAEKPESSTAGATRPRSTTDGRSDDTDESRCALAKDILNGSLAHPNGEPIDKYDLETAENDVRSYCKS